VFSRRGPQKTRRAVVDRLDLEAFLAQEIAEELAKLGVVVNDEDARLVSHALDFSPPGRALPSNLVSAFLTNLYSALTAPKTCGPNLVTMRSFRTAALALLLAVPSLAQAETLTAEQALGRAAAGSPSLRAALLDVASAQQGVLAERGARDAVFVAQVTGGYTEVAGGTATAVGESGISAEKSLASSAAIRYTTDAGTALELGTNGDVSWRTPSTALDDGPRYTAGVYASARQPLLRGAGSDAQLAPQRAAEASAHAAELTRDATASQLALDVVSAYWELWYAERALLVQDKALETAEKQLSDARIREGQLGTASKADVLQFLSNVAAIHDARSQALTARQTRALELGRLLGMDAGRSLALDASGELPALAPPPPSTALFESAVSSSPELGALRANLTASRARLTAAEDADQPRLDVFATASAGLLWADSAGAGYGLAGGRPAYSVVGGLELELPLGGGRAEADAARSRLELSAAEARYQERWLAVTSQIGALRASVEAAREQGELAAESVRVARELAEAERQRLLLGTTTSSEVVRAEQALRAAELRELRVRVSRVVSQYQLDHASGALLARLGNAFLARKS
jgi:outer membrane protein